MNTDQIAAIVGPLVEANDLGLYDVEQMGATLRISIDSEGGVPFEELERLSRDISFALDEADPSSGSYMLEVSTPGVERNLRTAVHFESALGEIITVKTTPGPEGRKRLRGELISSTNSAVTIVDGDLGEVELQLVDIESARTIFEWGPAPKPGQPGSSNKTHRRAS